MSISYEADGSVVLQSDIDPQRRERIDPDTPRAQQDAAIAAFFAKDGEAEMPAIDTA